LETHEPAQPEKVTRGRTVPDLQAIDIAVAKSTEIDEKSK
jgi:hypothetical protein